MYLIWWNAIRYYGVDSFPDICIYNTNYSRSAGQEIPLAVMEPEVALYFHFFLALNEYYSPIYAQVFQNTSSITFMTMIETENE
jgi:hypothetical protein